MVWFAINPAVVGLSARVSTPFSLLFGCRDPAPILCVNISEAARGETSLQR